MNIFEVEKINEASVMAIGLEQKNRQEMAKRTVSPRINA